MLVITRKVGQAIRIELDPSTDPDTPVGRLFTKGVIQVIVAQIRGSQARLGVSAPDAFAIVREELKLKG